MMKLKAVPYGSPEYWEKRYVEESDQDKTPGFEWYPGADEILCKELHQVIPEGDPILEIGSGSSELAIKLEERGYNVMFTDVSETVIEKMKGKWEDREEKKIDFAAMNACHLPLKTESLWAVVDKGTLDAVDCTDNRQTDECLREVHRVLAENGHYFLVSCREPDVRREDFGHLLDVEKIVEIRSDEGNRSIPCPDAYLYVLKKKGK